MRAGRSQLVSSRASAYLSLAERTNVVDQVPQLVRSDANVFQRHVSLAALKRAEHLSVAHFLCGSSIGEVGQLVAGFDFALAISGLPMAHGAIVPVIFLALRQRLGRG